MRLSGIAVLVLLPLVGCSSSSSTSSVSAADSTGNSTSASTLPACSWPASLDPPEDAGGWSWSVGRTYIACDDGNDFEDCISPDGVTCPGPNGIPGATLTNCKNLCKADEYAVSSGGPPAFLPDGGFTNPPEPNLPASCRFLSANPAGVAMYCCACE
jgi:hypothetical protein